MKRANASDANQLLAEGFANHMVQWAQDLNTPQHVLPVLYRASLAVSLATSAGNVCLPFVHGDWAGNLSPDTLRQTLLTCPLVGHTRDTQGKPLILDDENRLYLNRYFEYEKRLAEQIIHGNSALPLPLASSTKVLLHELFQMNATRLAGKTDWQMLASAMALQARLTIISGGPGTGKTTTVVSLLACALQQNPQCRIRLAAPTGKAAARMVEAIKLASTRLPAALVQQMPTEGYTVHRLLGVRGDQNGFLHHAANRLKLDLLVVDEASMLDLSLATHLLDAVPEGARLILLGDKDQLAAVEAGSVFADLCVSPRLSDACRQRLSDATGIPTTEIVPPIATPVSGLSDCVIWLTESFRFDLHSGIGQLAKHVNHGDISAALDFLESAQAPDLLWLNDDHNPIHATSERELRSSLTTYIEAARHYRGDTDRDALFESLQTFRVLCAEREGPRGVDAINQRLSHFLQVALGNTQTRDPDNDFYAFRPVMVLRNDYDLGLYNGDVGIVLPNKAGALSVHFPQPDKSYHVVSCLRLPEHDTALAMTVHKAQGSEFDFVTLVLPSHPSRVLSRELLYTAATRSKRRFTLIGARSVIQHAISHTTPRQSGFKDRIAHLLTQTHELPL